MKISDFIEMWHDKRFSKRFTLLNFLTDDYLRNYLAVGVEVPLSSIEQRLKNKKTLSESDIELLNYYLKRTKKGLDDVFNL